MPGAPQSPPDQAGHRRRQGLHRSTCVGGELYPSARRSRRALPRACAARTSTSGAPSIDSVVEAKNAESPSMLTVVVDTAGLRSGAGRAERSGEMVHESNPRRLQRRIRATPCAIGRGDAVAGWPKDRQGAPGGGWRVCRVSSLPGVPPIQSPRTARIPTSGRGPSYAAAAGHQGWNHVGHGRQTGEGDRIQQHAGWARPRWKGARKSRPWSGLEAAARPAASSSSTPTRLAGRAAATGSTPCIPDGRATPIGERVGRDRRPMSIRWMTHRRCDAGIPRGRDSRRLVRGAWTR